MYIWLSVALDSKGMGTRCAQDCASSICVQHLLLRFPMGTFELTQSRYNNYGVLVPYDTCCR